MAFATPLNLTTRPNTSHLPSTCRTRRQSETTPPRTTTARRPTPPPSMLVVEAFNTEQMDKIISAADDKLVIIDYSTTWCGPCRIFAPIFEELSDKYDAAIFVKVTGDVGEGSELMKREGIRAVPAFHFWKAGDRVRDITGSRKEEIEAAIEELM